MEATRTSETRAQGTPPPASGGPGPVTGRYLPIRRPWAVVIAAIVAFLAAGGVGFTVSDHLVGGGLVDPGSASTHANYDMETRFPGARPNVVVLVDTPGSVDDPAARAAGERVAADLGAIDGVAAVWSYWSTGDAALRSIDGRSALVVAVSQVDPELLRPAVLATAARVAADLPGHRVRLGGAAEVNRAVSQQTDDDLLRSELIALPLTLLALLLVFRGVTAALLPLGIGVFAIVLTAFILRIVTVFVPVSTFSLNLCTALGLGLAVDYALLMVRRFREESAAGLDVPDAVTATVRSAGRTVLFSAVTVMLALSALLVFPMYFLRSFAYAGIAVVLAAAAAALVVLPAVLTLAGRRVARPGRAAATGGNPAWRRLSAAVMRRPGLIAVAVIAGLVALSLPVTDVRFGPTDDRQLATEVPATQVQQALRESFPDVNGLTFVVLRGAADGPAVSDYTRRLSMISGVRRVESAAGTYATGVSAGAPRADLAARYITDGYAWLAVWITDPPGSAAARETVLAVRSEPAPAPAQVGGEAAEFVDTTDAVGRSLPWALLIISVSTLLVLLLLTGSVLIPVKALLLNIASLSVPFGATVWIFQQGHLRDLLGGFQLTGYIDITIVVLAFCVAFGLSMDYEVFLLSRIGEEHRRTGSTTEAVAVGLQRTGGVVTSAALLISIVLVSLTASGITDLKLLGIGLTLAILIDATVVRCILVPAIMKLLGDRNWWAPAPVRRVHRMVADWESGR
jgi:RND superfamily putative drug exporter